MKQGCCRMGFTGACKSHIAKWILGTCCPEWCDRWTARQDAASEKLILIRPTESCSQFSDGCRTLIASVCYCAGEGGAREVAGLGVGWVVKGGKADWRGKILFFFHELISLTPAQKPSRSTSHQVISLHSADSNGVHPFSN